MELDKMARLASELLRGKRSHPYKEVGNKYYHGLRTAKLAVTLRKLILPDDDSHDDILTAAAWFHDCANGGADHGNVGADYCMTALRGLCTDEELDEICHIIRVHDDRTHKVEYSPWVKLHQDADHLDHFGSYDVMMAFLECNGHDRTIDDMIKWFLEMRPGQRGKVKAQLNYDVSRRIYDEKIDFMVMFGERFKAECDGEIILNDE